MDVMRPDVYRIGRRFYRRNPLNPKFLSEGGSSYQPYEEEDPSEFRRHFDEGEAGAELGGDLQQLENGSWRLALQLPAQLFPALIGRRAETKKRLEASREILTPCAVMKFMPFFFTNNSLEAKQRCVKMQGIAKEEVSTILTSYSVPWMKVE